MSDFPLILDHIGIAVKDLDEATKTYQRLLSAEVVHDEVVASQKVRIRFLQYAGQKIELLQTTDVDGPVGKFIRDRGQGIHHIAFKTDDIFEEMVRLREKGYQILQEKPIQGAYDKLIFFVHPKSMGGTWVEVCQPISP